MVFFTLHTSPVPRTLPSYTINFMGIIIEAPSCRNETHSKPCQNAISDTKGEFRCRIYDQAQSEGFPINKLESSISPIMLHIKGCGEVTTRCMYQCGCLQRMCYGFLVNSEGLKNLIQYTKFNEKIIFPEKKNEITNVFGSIGYEIILRNILT